MSVDGFPGIRWSQTASYGYVPNPAMPKVFMAVAMDLGDPQSPYGSIHPRDKQDVGLRLSLAGRAVAYDAQSLYYSGPIANKITLQKGNTGMSATVTYRDVSETLLRQSSFGFELGCVQQGNNKTTFVEGTATGIQGANAMINFPDCPAGSSPKMVQYAWREDPCPFKQCAVYSGGLPSPPFMMEVAQN